MSHTHQHPAKPPAIDPAAFEPDARARAILRGVQIAQQDLRDAGGTYELEQVQTLLHGTSRQHIAQMVSEGALFSVPGPGGQRRYPTAQFNHDGTVVEGLEAVQGALPTRNPWAVLNFLVRPDARLDGRAPIEVLKEGQVGLVVEAARRVAEQGG